MTSFTSGGVPIKKPEYKITMSEEEMKVEPIDTPTKLPKYASSSYRE